MNQSIRIGTRGSKLALWQAHHVAGLLSAAVDGLDCEVVVVKTAGDKILDVTLAKIGDKGLFTKELEDQLIAGTVDVCVHSCKDMPTDLPAGLVLACMPARAQSNDCIVAARAGIGLADLAAGARVATGSLRRSAQLARLRPDVEICDIRGNVDTRIGKVLGGQFDCAILAEAGLRRLGLDEHISSVIPVSDMIPAVGQGAIVVEARDGDTRVADALAAIANTETMDAVLAERVVLAKLDGGCQVPMGAHGWFVDAKHPGTVHAGLRTDTEQAQGVARADAANASNCERTFVLDAFVASLDGTQFVRSHAQGPANQCEDVALAAVEDLLSQGAAEILEALR